MCIIMIADEGRLPEADLRAANTINSDGIGIAWHDGDEIRYAKGITLAALIKMNADDKKIPLPYIVHFRFRSAGSITPMLCHPFPIGKAKDELALSGKTDVALFHNGHWSGWEEFLFMYALNNKGVDFLGEWSDTRVMAHIYRRFGEDCLPKLAKLGGKVAILSKHSGAVYAGTGWTHNKKEGTLYSNYLRTVHVVTGKNYQNNVYGANETDYEDDPSSSHYFRGHVRRPSDKDYVSIGGKEFTMLNWLAFYGKTGEKVFDNFPANFRSARFRIGTQWYYPYEWIGKVVEITSRLPFHERQGFDTKNPNFDFVRYGKQCVSIYSYNDMIETSRKRHEKDHAVTLYLDETKNKTKEVKVTSTKGNGKGKTRQRRS